MVSQFLLWPPILWTARITLLIVIGAIGLATFLYFARFLRPKHLEAILLSDIPRVSEVGAEVGGNLVAIKLDQAQGAQVQSLLDRVAELERAARKAEAAGIRKESA